MQRGRSSFALIVMLALLSVWLIEAASAKEEQRPTGVWSVLRSYELRALRDYSHHVTTPDVRQRAELLWNLAQSPNFMSVRRSCGKAAEVLSYMVTGFFESSHRLEVAYDWHHFAGQYIDRRGACLTELGLNAHDYPLPYWFTR